ncbi:MULTISPECIES: RagB/SusD family nutrient uptake outer membrane protein [Roseivirga]|jgi:hypothetical protein|uniref:Carbohydrate-binding protein SusD n=1 Tax=Roseivirga spongicola TaxID=333140 RepID=A0A150WXM2_9BACT|nr:MULTISPECIES: RagB/SusD family nutrient uptake outer membrane protein [Roseivirga]KYG71235.1 hypothetical protein AWW68_18680 [Roseivirga spongicola]MBO6497069.1 RagB/SusD family nutrient uptake outer membrane protein [Roseivirga sp.]PWL31271.1 MAG: RagB/SusD family nutrient uptake outer membrane protein [Roseivirga sp. XM-24bin3]WPZ12289.1 RagB/SusD family nutrient uptake outer membrane protein [Roseivirga spongicola]
MKKYFITTLCLIAILATSCSDLLETEPRQSVSIDGALESPDVLNALLIDVYNSFQGGGTLGSEWIVVPEVMADNFTFNNNRGTYNGQYNNVLRSHLTAWEVYGYLLQLNVVIEGGAVLDDNTLGEAYALRALGYLYLMNTYAYMPTAIVGSQNKGGVPLITEAVLDLADVTLPARASIDEVYDFMLADVAQAISLMDNSRSNARFTQAGAQALGSRIALYAGEYALSVQYAQAAIDAGTASLSTRDNYVSDWAQFQHPEAIWYLEYQSNENQGPNTSVMSIYITDGTVITPDYRGNGDFTPAQEVLDLLGPTDVRNGLIEEVQTSNLPNPVGTPELKKYIDNGGQGNLTNIPIFRISEMYLNIAEAEARLGNTLQAQAALQTLKRRSVSPTYIVTNTGQDLIDEILVERRLELLGEGHRFFDLKRLGMDIDKSAVDLTGEVISFDDARILAPLPSGDLELNPNLENNFGY